MRQIKIPGPDHPIATEPHEGTVRVTWKGQVVAETRHAVKLEEAGYPPVYYIPRKDLRSELLRPSETSTYCPYKGEASYFSIPAGGDRSVDAIWTYEAPHDAVAVIRDHLAFYPSRVDAIEER